MWKIAFVMGILVVAIYAAPQAPAEDKHEPVNWFNRFSVQFEFKVEISKWLKFKILCKWKKLIYNFLMPVQT